MSGPEKTSLLGEMMKVDPKVGDVAAAIVADMFPADEPLAEDEHDALDQLVGDLYKEKYDEQLRSRDPFG